MSIAPGTLCWLVKTAPSNAHWIGRVVVVVSGLQPMPQRGGEFMHLVDAEWLRIERPRTHLYAAPSALKPIAGPDLAPVAPREREPEPETA